MRTTDHQLVTGQANDINQLLEYYLGDDSTVSEQQVLDAWRRLAEAAHDKLGTGWNMRLVEKHFQPHVLDPEETYDREMECCGACELANGECLTHREAGAQHDQLLDNLARVMQVFKRDPEQLGALLERADGRGAATVTQAHIQH